MKTKLLTKWIYTFLFIVFINQIISAQLRIIKVNPATEEVTIKNFGSATNITNYWLCNYPSYDQFSSMTIISGDFNLSLNEEVTVTSSVSLADGDGELGLYNTNSFSLSTAMEDYMQWGTSGHQRESVAVTKGIWETGTTINVTPPYEYIGDGMQNGVTKWVTLSSQDFSLARFTISPNPTNDFIKIQFSNSISYVQIEIFNVLGKQVYSTSYTSNTPIDVSHLGTGLYFLKASSDGIAKTKKIIKY